MTNVCTFSGNLGRDAERRQTNSGTAILNFSVPAKSGFGQNEKTTWINCALFGKRAEGGLCDILTKGTPVVVTGELSQREWTNNAGEVKTSLELNVNDVTLMGKGKPKEDNPYQEADDAAEKESGSTDALDDEIPF